MPNAIVAQYINFVREGVGLASIWDHLKNQIFLGSDNFINKKQDQINNKQRLSEVPRLQKRKVPKPLDYYDNKYSDQNQAIVKANLSSGSH